MIVFIFGYFDLSAHCRQRVAGMLIRCRGKRVAFPEVVAFNVHHAAHQLVSKIVGPICVAVGFERCCPFWMLLGILIAHPYPQWDAGVAETAEVGQSVAVGNTAVVGEIHHRLHIQSAAAVVEETAQHAVGVAYGVLIIGYIIVVTGLSPKAFLCRKAVLEVEMAAFQMQYYEVVLIRIDFIEDIKLIEPVEPTAANA